MNARDAVRTSELNYKAELEREVIKGGATASRLIKCYVLLAEIQEHLNWVAGIVFDALVNFASNGRFASVLSTHYKQKAMEAKDEFQQAPTIQLQYRRQSDSDTRGVIVEGPTRTIYEVLRLGATFERGELTDAEVALFLECASVGLEFLGIHFVLVRNPKNWKIFKREVSFSRRLLFEPDYPCPPLISVVDSLGIGLCASAILSTLFPCPNIPIHLPPFLRSTTMSLINPSLISFPSVRHLISPLPNPSLLLSAFAPQLISLHQSFEPSAVELISKSIMCLGLPKYFPTLTSTDQEMEMFGRSVFSAARGLNRMPDKELQECNSTTFVEVSLYGPVSVWIICSISMILLPEFNS